MKLILTALLVGFALSLTACGSSGSGSATNTNGLSCSSLAGHYNNDFIGGETMDISNSCTLTDSYCGYDASYTVPTSLDNGTMYLTVNNTNGTPGCMSNTTHVCVVEVIGNQLGVNCDNGAQVFLFTKQ